MKRIVLAALAVAAVLVSFEIGRVSSAPASFVSTVVPKISQKAAAQPSNIDLSQFWEVWSDVHKYYYGRDTLDNQTLVYGAVKGMVQATGDKYGGFFTPEESKNFYDSITGKFPGIGAEIGIKYDQITVVAPLKGTPAERAGLKPKDTILKIDDRSTAAMTLDQAVSLIKGPTGTKVRLTIGRDGVDKPLEITITRAEIDVPVVDGKMVEPGVGYISISEFSGTLSAKFRDLVVQLKKQGMTRLVLDLRNDPGGKLDVAVEVAAVFTGPNQLIVTEKQPDGTATPHQTVAAALIADLPTVVLVNVGSASAAEILAGALRDIKGIQLVGEQTFGKGSVQTLNEYNNDASLKITTAHWFTPKGYSIQDQGLAPDTVVKQDSAKDNLSKDDAQFQAALQALRRP